MPRPLLLPLLAAVLAAAPAARAEHLAEGYAVPYHLAQGETVRFHVRSSEPFRIRILRQGVQRILVHESPLLAAATPPTNPYPWIDGAGWPSVYEFTIPAAWPSAIYLAQIVPQDTPSQARFAFFVLRQATPGTTSKILFVPSTNTWQAYNYWGGKSVYTSTLPGDPDPSTVVNFQRPFERDTNNVPGVSNHYRFIERLVEWLGTEGIPIEVASDADVHEIPDLLDRYNAVVVVSAGEYYSKEIFDALERFRDEGGSIAFLSATNIHWAVRYEARGRKLVTYKSRCPRDPWWGIDPSRVTCRWNKEQMNRPSESLAGGAYVLYSPHALLSPCVVADSGHWIFDGTGLKNGDPIGATMCGGEVDAVTEYSPPGIQVLLSSVLPHEYNANHPGFLHEATFHEVTKGNGFPTNSHGRVFDAGTVRWVMGLQEDPNVGIITRNILETFAARRHSKHLCDNGRDDDGDGLEDLDDPGCWGSDDPSEHDGALPCDDGLDNDGDGYTDLDDPVCEQPTATREGSQCQDGVDNDDDGSMDFDGGASMNGGVPLMLPDSLCVAAATATERRSCGLGFELAALAPWVARRRRRSQAARS